MVVVFSHLIKLQQLVVIHLHNFLLILPRKYNVNNATHTPHDIRIFEQMLQIVSKYIYNIANQHAICMQRSIYLYIIHALYLFAYSNSVNYFCVNANEWNILYICNNKYFHSVAI